MLFVLFACIMLVCKQCWHNEHIMHLLLKGKQVHILFTIHKITVKQSFILFTTICNIESARQTLRIVVIIIIDKIRHYCMLHPVDWINVQKCINTFLLLTAVRWRRRGFTAIFVLTSIYLTVNYNTNACISAVHNFLLKLAILLEGPNSTRVDVHNIITLSPCWVTWHHGTAHSIQ